MLLKYFKPLNKPIKTTKQDFFIIQFEVQEEEPLRELAGWADSAEMIVYVCVCLYSCDFFTVASPMSLICIMMCR